MKHKEITIVGILFNEEDVPEILEYLESKKFFSKENSKKFLKNMRQGITETYNEIVSKNENFSVMELVAPSMSSDEYFIGYRIDYFPVEIPTNSEQLEQIKIAKNKWTSIFGEEALVQSVRFIPDEDEN